MSDIFRQVDEDLRKEKLSNLWKKYGLYTISFIVFVVIIVLTYQYKLITTKERNEQLLEIYISASNNESLSQKIALLEEVIDSNNEYLSNISELKVSNLKLDKGDIDGSLTSLERIINDKNSDPIINDLATYYLLMLRIDTISENEFTRYLTENKIQESNFKHLYLELIAIKKLLLGKEGESRERFLELNNLSDTPLDIKIRAKKFIEILN